MLIYIARQDVLNLSRSRQIWPKELQLISRQTEKQVKKLASIYRKGGRTHRIEPFATEDQKFYPMHSPKAKVVVDQDISCEKKQNDVLAAATVIPTMKKIQMSNSKQGDYKYKPITNENKSTLRIKNQSRLMKMPNSNHKPPSR